MRRFLFIASAVLFFSGCAARERNSEDDPFVRAIASLRSSVVLFTMKVPSDDPKRKREFDDAYGSGVIVASGSWGTQFLTVAHVVQGARNLHVRIEDRREFPARVVVREEKEDLALVEASVPNLAVAHLGSSNDLRLGQAIGMAGYPLPDAFTDEQLGVSLSVFSGRIAGLNTDALELDLPIIPGESGGPVFDARTAEVVGLAQSRFDEERAIGFAIPIDDAVNFLHNHLHGT
ncbi:MAG TPA: trypsin-like peptidase domain-containing protein [Candidatus Baltobacteraceae bacterium]|jgi:serine protease Do|nr:trypsin-like peptidase domain-containing protein [Candidatus Baltobacteraceae bacterium]